MLSLKQAHHAMFKAFEDRSVPSQEPKRQATEDHSIQQNWAEIDPVLWRQIQRKLEPIVKWRQQIDVYGIEFRMFGHGFWTPVSQTLTERYGLPPCGGLLLRQFYRRFLDKKQTLP